ncbi:MAG: rod shape-determining protein MreD [Selenomonas sp.]|nr:rod shape-determining protein MreD [Selenomonas sp.]
MSNIIKWLVFVMVLYALQTSFFPLMSYHGVSPDFMLLLTTSFAFLRGKEQGAMMGFATGMTQDLAMGSFLGAHAFTHLLVGYLCGRLANRVFKEQFFLPVFASLAVTAANYFILALLMVLLGYRFNPISNVQYMLLPMLIYQLAFAYPVHYLTYIMDKKLRTQETN